MKNLFFVVFMFCNYFVAHTQNFTLTHLESIVQNNPQSSAASFNVGQYHFFNGKFAEANTHLEKAITIDDEDSDFLFFQALAYEGQGKVEQALNYYDKAIALEAGTEYLIRRGHLRYKLKKYAGAAKDFREILETYEDMADIKKLLQDCEKNGGKEDKETESNAATALTPEAPAAFIEKALKQFEKFSDAGELYRGMLHFFTNNVDKAMPIFAEFIKKDRDAETMFFNAIANEVKGTNQEAALSYLGAIREIEDEIVETSFEKLAGSPKATKDLERLQSIKQDYQFALKKLSAKVNPLPTLPASTNTAIKGEVRTAKTIYTFSVEKQEAGYQLVVRDKNLRKAMLSEVKVEKKDGGIKVKIIWGEKKDESGLTWAVRSGDFFNALYVSGSPATFSHEGERMNSNKRKNLDWATLAAIQPRVIDEAEVLSFAARAFMVGYLIKE